MTRPTARPPREDDVLHASPEPLPLDPTPRPRSLWAPRATLALTGALGLLAWAAPAAAVELPGSLAKLKQGLPAELIDPRALAGLLGLLLLIAGSRFYRVAIIAPGFLAGVALADHFLSGLGGALPLIFALLLGAGGALACHVAERVAVRLVGAVIVSGVVHAVAPLLFQRETPWWWAPVAGAVGLLLFPRLYERLLPLIGAVLGAICVAWAAGKPQEVGLIGALAAGGLVVQLVWRAVAGEASSGNSGGKGKGKGKAKARPARDED
ncbi:MAG: hypothetical protein JNM72_16390 [Deltaproteobacteria bacterium]|nr:hypothetical protein [Deltaproteobacteria bacterium]